MTAKTPRKPETQLGQPDNPAGAQNYAPDEVVLETPCTVQELQNWLKDLHTLFPGDSVTLTIETDIHKIEAVTDTGRP
jgi:hypothetical protein